MIVLDWWRPCAVASAVFVGTIRLGLIVKAIEVITWFVNDSIDSEITPAGGIFRMVSAA